MAAAPTWLTLDEPGNAKAHAPAIFVDQSTGTAVYHADGRPVTKGHPAKRDEKLYMFATGLGVTRPRVATGVSTPATTEAVTDPIQVFFGDPTWSQAGIIVDSSQLEPGMIGLYRIDLRVPGNHIKGDALRITLKIGTVQTPATAPVIATVAVE